MGFCGRVTNRSATAFRRIRPVETLTIQRCHLSLSLSAACVLVAIFFIPFFPRHRRENWSWLDHDEIAVFRGREARWWFIVPSRDSLNPSKSGRGLEVFSESRRRNLEEFFYIFTSRSIWMIVLKINIFTIKLSNRSRQGGFVICLETKGWFLSSSKDTIRW